MRRVDPFVLSNLHRGKCLKHADLVTSAAAGPFFEFRPSLAPGALRGSCMARSDTIYVDIAEPPLLRAGM